MPKIISNISGLFARLAKDEDGTQLVETAIWLGIISAATVISITAMAPFIEGIYANVLDAINGP